MIRLFASALCCLLLFAASASGVTTIDPTDSNILYTGRWNASTPSQPWCYWIGSSVMASFEGTSLAIITGAGSGAGPDYLRIIIDDDLAGSTKIPVGSTVATYELASDLADRVHKAEIVKETDVGNWVFHGFELDDGKSLASPPARPPRRIEFYGDSNLAGYSLESEENESGGHLRGSYYGYAGIVSRVFDAEYHNVSRSGAKIADINAVYNRYAYLSPTPAWDFNLFPADVVVVNLGANNVGRPVSRIRSDYHDFLDDLRSVHPGAHIMLYNGWGWDYDEPANYTHEVIAERGDPNMSSAIFPWVFEQWHGCEYDHAGMAQILADHLTAVMGWAQGPRDVMNGYGMNGDIANGSFEEEAPFGGYGWRYLSDEGVDRIHDQAGAYDGSYYLRLSNGAASHQPNPAEDGDTFTLSVWMRGGQAGDQVDITMDFRDQEMWTSPLQAETETRTLTADWQQYSMEATAPTGAAKPVFHTRATFTSAAGDIVDIDGVVMSSGAAVGDSESPHGAYGLSAHPNPFKPSTKISFRVPEAGHVVLSVYDVSGRQVATLADGYSQSGEFAATWDGRDTAGIEAGPGIYFVRMKMLESSVTSKIVRLK